VSSPRPHLSRERIALAAIELIDRDGLESLSMRRLGAALGVEAMSVYRHFPSKAALLDLVAETLLGELELPPPTAEWRGAFRESARAYRALLLRHPNAIPLLATLQLTNAGATRAAGSIMALLRGIGLDAQAALSVFSSIVSYVVGFAFWETGTAPFRTDPARGPIALPADADPYLVALAPELAKADCTDSFEMGLDLFIGGLERHLSAA